MGKVRVGLSPGTFDPITFGHMDILRRAAKLDNVKTFTFDAAIEALIARAAGLVAMGGYNTFCEILSFDKRALIVPRTTPPAVRTS